MALTLDVETHLLAEDVGGWDNFLDLGIACCVAFDDEAREYHVFSDDTGRHRPIVELADVLQDARRRGQPVIGHNVARFDLPLIAKNLTDRGADASFMGRMRVIDTILHLRKATGAWVSLSNVTKRTDLGKKTMDGKDAPMRWRAGQHDEVIAYCKNDVDLEYALYRHCVDGKPVRVWVSGPDKNDFASWDEFERACVKEFLLEMRPALLETVWEDRAPRGA